ncbi:nucleotidyltransferase domain-containing protein [Paenibacillus sp. CN-4]|uniref:nucleotidyltransferase domain-containing protein n=1 Tax=Paenibacillus nanchangensis TaxID=3348343 RepID=UPI00397D50D0
MTGGMGGIHPDAVERMLMVCRRTPELKQLVLFGSRAQGRHGPGSDIDLMYTGENVPARFAHELAEAAGLYRLDLLEFRQTLDVVLKREIERNGIVFYERIQE